MNSVPPCYGGEGRPLRVIDVVASELFRKLPGKATWSATRDGLRLDVQRNRYYRDEPDGFGYRSVTFRIGTDHKALASGSFVEWNAPGLGFLEDFFWAADAISQADHDTADILRRYWDDEDSPFHYGTVISFERLAITPSAKSPTIWQMISEMLKREFMRRGAILLLKAFPLEYEGRLTKDSPAATRKRFRLRCKAMRRYYRHRIGVRPVPGEYGRDGWMWRAPRCCLAARAKR